MIHAHNNPRDLVIAVGVFGAAVYVVRNHPDFFAIPDM